MFCASLKLHLRIGYANMYALCVWFMIMLWYLTMCIIDEHVLFTKRFLIFFHGKIFLLSKDCITFQSNYNCRRKKIHFQIGLIQ